MSVCAVPIPAGRARPGDPLLVALVGPLPWQLRRPCRCYPLPRQRGGQLAAFAILAVSLDLVWGYLCILSLGHGLFFAIGGYVSRHAPACPGLRGDGPGTGFGAVHGVEEPAVLLAGSPTPPMRWRSPRRGGGRCLGFGFVASFRSRVNGVYFSIISQALVYVAMLLMFRNDTGLGGNNGMTGFTPRVRLADGRARRARASPSPRS